MGFGPSLISAGLSAGSLHSPFDIQDTGRTEYHIISSPPLHTPVLFIQARKQNHDET